MDTNTNNDTTRELYPETAPTEDTAALVEVADREAAGAIAAEDSEEENLILTLGKPYKFEGQTYTEVNLSGLEDASAADLAAVNKILTKRGVFSPMPEMTLDFSVFMAARVSKLPSEFFLGLPSRDTIKLKNVVTGFLYSGDGEG